MSGKTPDQYERVIEKIEKFFAAYAIEFILIIVLLVASIISIVSSNNWNGIGWYEVVPKLSSEIAIASFIALFIVVFVERRARARQHRFFESLQRKIQQDVFKAMLAPSYPKTIRETVIEKVLHAKIVRPRTTLNFSFEQEDGFSPEHVKLVVCVEYGLKNVTMEPYT